MSRQGERHFVVDFRGLDRSDTRLVGGKMAQLGELAQVDGIAVPDGVCITTDAFSATMAACPELGHHLTRLGAVEAGDLESLRTVSTEIRQIIEQIEIPDEVEAAIVDAVGRLGDGAYAVRSSATAEDLPTASFAGQYNSYLNVVGIDSILTHVRRCWASLFAERAVAYRDRIGLDPRDVAMAVVVQRMVDAAASGVAFTADPVNGNRAVVSVEAVFGLGEALVSGEASADVFAVRDGQIIDKTVAAKDTAVTALSGGGTLGVPVEPERQDQPVLDDGQVLELARLARRVEDHFAWPQDLEWCLVDGGFVLVQSRPITTLFPVPPVEDGANHVYISVGHQQMMTDAMKPLGISVWMATTRAPMVEAGGRLFVDVTSALASPTSRVGLLGMAMRSDPLIADALETVIERGFVSPSDDAPKPPTVDPPAPLANDPAIVRGLIEQMERSNACLADAIREQSGVGLVDYILDDFAELQRLLFDPLSHQAIMAGMEATWWLNDHIEEWLGERGAADTLTLSAPDNVTSEMGLDLLDVADAIRPHREVVAYLDTVDGDDFLDELSTLEGGVEARDAIAGYLDRYGMRCVGEIDITRPRWAERPSALLPRILRNVEDFEPGESRRRYQSGLQAAADKTTELLDRLRELPDGEQKAESTSHMIERVRTFIGYREYPKYGMISRYFIYKKALLAEAGRLTEAGVLREPDDIFFLTLEELREVVRSGAVDNLLVDRRKDELRFHNSLRPPRVLTSEGEGLGGHYRHRQIPSGALPGLAVSGGTVEGRARVVLEMSEADLNSDDILVTAYTDPSWSPLFVAIKGLVTEVGGLMSHGSVVAREYGLPAVVGVEDATRLISDGQRIIVNGTHGYVEVLDG